jgi:hypothetical protein
MNRNNEKPNTLTERYIYVLSRRLPSAQRGEITKEVRGIISDMLQDMFPDQETDESSVKTVLNKLGDPRKLADSYMNRRSHLIGPEYFSTYMLILKIVIPVAVAGVSLAMVLEGIFNTPGNIPLFIFESISAVFAAAVQAFAWVTGIFALVEHFADPLSRRNVIEADETAADWSVDDLPEIPAEKAVIKKSEPIVGIVFTVIFLILINFAPHILGIIVADNGTTIIIPVFDMNNFYRFLPIFNTILCLGLLKEAIRFFEGKYTLRSSIAIMLISAASMVMFFAAIRNPELWNDGFATELESIFNTDGTGTFFGLISYMPKLYNIILGLGIFGFIAETASNLHKSIRYR